MEAFQPVLTLGDHKLIRKISEGSYGEVWLAQNELGTYRAVKIIRQARFDNARPFQREYEGIKEFEPVSRTHEGLVDILHLGKGPDPDSFYYVMELADDTVLGERIEPEQYQPRTLASELVSKGPVSVSDCVRTGLLLCRTLAFLHERGLIHRDIKPSNVIFVGDQPKLADIGLVSKVDNAKTFVGTAGFIPPEGPNSPQADIYALGKLLYELSTGYDRQEFPVLPAKTEFSAEFLELNEVLTKACHSDPARRYRSATLMAGDLEMLLAGRSVRRLHQLEAKLRSFQRSGLALLAILSILAVVYYQVSSSLQRARERRANVIGSKVAQGTALLKTGDRLGALPFFLEALELDLKDQTAAAMNRLRIGSILTNSPHIQFDWRLREGSINSCDLHGQFALITIDRKYSQVFDINSGERLSPQLGNGTHPESAVFMPDGNSILTANWDETARVINWRTGIDLLVFNHPGTVLCAGVNRAGTQIVTGCKNGAVFLWDCRTKKRQLLGMHDDPVASAKFSNSGRLVVTASEDGTARIWDVESLAELRQLRHQSWVYEAEFSPDEKFVATACYDGEARIWAWNSTDEEGREEMPPLRHDGGVHSIHFSPEGDLILTSCLDGIARLWSRRNHQLIAANHSLRHSARLSHACFGTTTNVVLTCDMEGAATLWSFDSSAQRPLPLGKLETENLPEARSSPNRRWQLKTDGTRFFVVQEAHAVRIPIPLAHAPSLTRFDPTSRFFFAVDESTVHLVDLKTHKARALPHPDPVTYADFSPDGSKLVCVSRDFSFARRSALLWDTSTATVIGKPLSHGDGVIFATFSPDSKLVVTTSEDSSARIWEAGTGRRMPRELEHHEKVRHAAFARRQPWVATVSDDHSAVIWDETTGMPLTPPLQHKATPIRVRFTDSDSAIVTTDSEGNSWKWRLVIDPRPPEVLHKVVGKLAGSPWSE